MSQSAAEVLPPDDGIIEKFVNDCRNAQKRINPPAFNHIRDLLSRFGIGDVEAVQSKSGLGTHMKLDDGRVVTIGRRYGYMIESSEELIKLFCLPPCRYVVFFTETKTLSQSFSSTLLFVGCLCVTGEGARAKVTKMIPYCFIDSNSNTVFVDRDEVIMCFLKFQKIGKETSSRTKGRSRDSSPVVNTASPCDSVEREAPDSCGDSPNTCVHVEVKEEEHQEFEVKQEQEQVDVVVATDDGVVATDDAVVATDDAAVATDGVFVLEDQNQMEESGILENQTPEESGVVDVNESSNEPDFCATYTNPFGEEYSCDSYPSGDGMYLSYPNEGDSMDSGYLTSAMDDDQGYFS